MMNNMNIIVESRLSGPASGQLVVNTDQGATVESVIVAFCTDKDLRNPGHYTLRTANDLMLDNTRTLEFYGLVDGDIIYLTNRSSSDEPFGFNNSLIMAGISLLIAVCGFVSVGLIYSTTGDFPDDYGIVFDAGSTHTTMMLYKWGGGKVNDTGTPQQVDSCEMQGGGISMYVGREDKLADALQKCLNEGKSHVPGGKVSSTPVFLGATGGMRVLNMQNQAAVKKLLDTIKQTFSSSGFKFQDDFVRIISGYEEGGDAWVTSNYLMKSVISNAHKMASVGTLDLGGASTQWAYQVGKNGTANYTLYGQSYDVLTDSYLCFGRYQSQLRYTAQLTVGLINATENVTDACLPAGFQFHTTIKDIFASPCAQMKETLRPNLNETTNITIVGSSSTTKCSMQVASLFNKSECMNYYNYSECFTPQNLSKTMMSYLAISGFYEIMNYMNLTGVPFSLEKFHDTVDETCRKTWPQNMAPKTEKGYSSTAPQNWCYLGHYVNHLLTTGYGFSNKTEENLVFKDSLNDTELGWTLGFMINATNSIAAESPLQPFKPAVFVFLMILFSIFVMLSMAFSVHAWRRKHRATGYQRLSQYDAI